jgi:hypothetical protein
MSAQQTLAGHENTVFARNGDFPYPWWPKYVRDMPPPAEVPDLGDEIAVWP